MQTYIIVSVQDDGPKPQSDCDREHGMRAVSVGLNDNFRPEK